MDLPAYLAVSLKYVVSFGVRQVAHLLDFTPASIRHHGRGFSETEHAEEK